jgi:hypothetical protein
MYLNLDNMYIYISLDGTAVDFNATVCVPMNRMLIVYGDCHVNNVLSAIR